MMKRMAKTETEARDALAGHLDSGRALQKFRDMVTAQGGNFEASRPRGPMSTLRARSAGFVAALDTERIGLAVAELGGGRTKVQDRIDHSVGLEMLVRLGDQVDRDQPLLHVFARTDIGQRAIQALEHCIKVDPNPGLIRPLVIERTRGSGTHPGNAVAVEQCDRSQLVRRALAARVSAYAPYSGFRVGAALMAESGRIFCGSNVENASLGLTICAERSAIVAAIAAGERRFKALAIAADGGAAPCGACRQFAAEFCDELPIFVVDSKNPSAMALETSLNRLLPGRFAWTGPSNQDSRHTSRHEAGQRTSEHGPET
jgi:homotetrameric cytidine deaminase